MEYFRLEVNPDEIGIVLDTNTRNNIKRCPYQNDFSEVLKMILGVSAQTGFTLNETYAMVAYFSIGILAHFSISIYNNDLLKDMKVLVITVPK